MRRVHFEDIIKKESIDKEQNEPLAGEASLASHGNDTFMSEAGGQKQVESESFLNLNDESQMKIKDDDVFRDQEFLRDV